MAHEVPQIEEFLKGRMKGGKGSVLLSVGEERMGEHKH